MDSKLIQALSSLSVETGSLVCLDCSYENACSIHGCAIMRIAADRLEQLTAEPPNNPLTLEELRRMDGEPVWVQAPGVPKYGRWAIVAGVDTGDGEQTLYCRGDYTCRYYGKTWLAYRRKPERSR